MRVSCALERTRQNAEGKTLWSHRAAGEFVGNDLSFTPVKDDRPFTTGSNHDIFHAVTATYSVKNGGFSPFFKGNHAEDVKECYFYLDNTPTHSYMKYLYKYPQSSFPYEEILNKNEEYKLQQMRENVVRDEYELLDTGKAVRDGVVLNPSLTTL